MKIVNLPSLNLVYQTLIHAIFFSISDINNFFFVPAYIMGMKYQLSHTKRIIMVSSYSIYSTNLFFVESVYGF